MHALKNSKLSITKNMKTESNAPNFYIDFIIDYGAPNKIVSNNAQVYCCTNWTTINRKYCIETGLTPLYH